MLVILVMGRSPKNQNNQNTRNIGCDISPQHSIGASAAVHRRCCCQHASTRVKALCCSDACSDTKYAKHSTPRGPRAAGLPRCSRAPSPRRSSTSSGLGSTASMAGWTRCSAEAAPSRPRCAGRVAAWARDRCPEVFREAAACQLPAG